jgi:putative colanic acid biosynthesis acetyltransferase WcaF
MLKTDLHSPVFDRGNKIRRLVWALVYYVFFRFTPVPLFSFRRLVLVVMGAKIAVGARVYPSCRVWIPENLIVGADATIGPGVNVYNQGKISIGPRSIISQRAHLCASTHDYNERLHPLLVSPISIGSDVWICTEAFIGPGVSLGNGSVVGARAVQVRNTVDWSVNAGNPSVYIKNRRSF